MTYKEFISQNTERVLGNDTAEWRGMDVMLDYIRLTDILMVKPYQIAPRVHALLTPYRNRREPEKVIYFHDEKDITKYSIAYRNIIDPKDSPKDICMKLDNFLKAEFC